MSQTPVPVLMVPVLIVGGGVVGLTASLFLAQQGIQALLVERHPGTSIYPRARGVNGRTMELLRNLGLEADVRRAGEKIAPSFGVYSGTTLRQVLESRGQEGWISRWLRKRAVHGRESRHSPTAPCRVTQDDLEPVLLQAARARGVDARFSTELLSVETDSEGVTATILDRTSGERYPARAAYVIAADGARSPMREALGVAQRGAGVLTHQVNLYFQAELTPLVRGREFSMCLVENPAVRGLFASVNNTDLWVFHVSYFPEKGQSPEDFTPEHCTGLIRSAVGMPDLAVTLKGVSPWQSAVRVAETFQRGRIFLAGDAAHVMPPWGGFGANTGMQDAHNLAWKLALVLKGVAHPSLLETYDPERRPVAEVVSALAGDMNDARGLMRIRPGLGMFWNMRKVFPYLVMGYGYGSRAVVLEPGLVPGPGTTELKGRPGTRSPHFWLRRGEQTVSPLDLCGPDFVLLAGEQGRAWLEAARSVSSTGIPLQVLEVGLDVQETSTRWHKAFGVRLDGAVLLRPDGIVAWRAKGLGSKQEVELKRVLDQVLGRGE